MNDTTATKNDRLAFYLAMGFLGLTFYVVTLVFVIVALKIEISAVMMALVTMVVGSVTTGIGVILNWMFGSSRGSQVKDATIAALTPPPAPTPTSGPASALTIQPTP